MQVYVMARTKSRTDSQYTDTYFSVCGLKSIGDNIPIRVKYFGGTKKTDSEQKKPEDAEKVEKNSEPVVDSAYEEYVDESDAPEKKDGEDAPEKKDGEKKEKKDEGYNARREVLLMFAGNMESGEVKDPVELIAKRPKSGSKDSEEAYYLQCGRERIRIEVSDFTTDKRVDYHYLSNCRKLRALSTLE